MGSEKLFAPAADKGKHLCGLGPGLGRDGTLLKSQQPGGAVLGQVPGAEHEARDGPSCLFQLLLLPADLCIPGLAAVLLSLHLGLTLFQGNLILRFLADHISTDCFSK